MQMLEVTEEDPETNEAAGMGQTGNRETAHVKIL